MRSRPARHHPAPVRALRVFARRPGTLLALGAAITLLAPSCACGIGALLLPPLLQELVRITLLEALRLGPDAPPLPLIAKRSLTTLASHVVVLGVLGVAGVAGSGASVWLFGGSVGYETAMWGALVGAGAAGGLLAPLVFLPYAAVERGRTPGDGFAHATKLTGALPWGRVALVSAAVPLLLAAPFVVLAALPEVLSIPALLTAAATSALLVPLVFCGLAAIYAEASERAALLTPPIGSVARRAPSIVPGVSVSLALVGLLGGLLSVVLFRPSTLEPLTREAGTPDSSLIALDPFGTVAGTQVRLTAAETGVRISVDDGGGAGLVEGVPHPTAYRIEPRRDVCQSCFTLMVTNDSVRGSTVLDASGVRHDDGAAARLARGVGPLAWLAIGAALLLAGLATALARSRRTATAPLLLLVVVLLVAVIDVARALWR